MRRHRGRGAALSHLCSAGGPAADQCTPFRAPAAGRAPRPPWPPARCTGPRGRRAPGAPPRPPCSALTTEFACHLEFAAPRACAAPSRRRQGPSAWRVRTRGAPHAGRRITIARRGPFGFEFRITKGTAARSRRQGGGSDGGGDAGGRSAGASAPCGGGGRGDACPAYGGDMAAAQRDGPTSGGQTWSNSVKPGQIWSNLIRLKTSHSHTACNNF
jgi:hypothetical protein